MTIHDCISKHSLTQRNVSRGGKWVPASLAVPRGDDFEVFGNDDGPLVVVLNTTKTNSRSYTGDMVFRETDWLAAGRIYETNARPFWK